MMRAMGLLIVGGFALLASNTAADAAGCGVTCVRQKVVCMGSARVDRLGCKANCRVVGSLREQRQCLRGCMAGFTRAKRTCGDEHVSCRSTCTPGGGGSCPGECARELGACGRNVSRLSHTCRATCDRVPFDGGRCLGVCTAAARLGHNACDAAHQTCLRRCAGSPGGAFVD